jgi:hypothetical protein
MKHNLSERELTLYSVYALRSTNMTNEFADLTGVIVCHFHCGIPFVGFVVNIDKSETYLSGHVYTSNEIRDRSFFGRNINRGFSHV